nr:hypothetical protein CFP56_41251 [Quercus suber]
MGMIADADASAFPGVSLIRETCDEPDDASAAACIEEAKRWSPDRRRAAVEAVQAARQGPDYMVRPVPDWLRGLVTSCREQMARSSLGQVPEPCTAKAKVVTYLCVLREGHCFFCSLASALHSPLQRCADRFHRRHLGVVVYIGGDLSSVAPCFNEYKYLSYLTFQNGVTNRSYLDHQLRLELDAPRVQPACLIVQLHLSSITASLFIRTFVRTRRDRCFKYRVHLSWDLVSVQSCPWPYPSPGRINSPHQRSAQKQVGRSDTSRETTSRHKFGKGWKEQMEDSNMDAPAITQPKSAARAKRPADLNPQTQSAPLSPIRQPYPSTLAASPSRLRSSSPRLSSPASSEIFERNVQEPVPMSTLQSELSPAHIPTHVMTEDHIPPALEASAQAITSNSLNPDEVEIVMSAAHQPAAASVLEGSHADLSQLNSPALQQRGSDATDGAPLQSSGLLPPAQSDEDGSTNSYGQLDPNDVRRLSFISFADVVQSEHNEQIASTLGAEAGSSDSFHLANLPTITSTSDGTTSPLRSPASTISGTGIATPPPGPAALDPIIKNAEQSPTRSPGSSSQHGDLTIETMRQAVRKTASGDLGAAGRSPGPQALSPVGSGIGEDALAREARSRANS